MEIQLDKDEWYASAEIFLLKFSLRDLTDKVVMREVSEAPNIATVFMGYGAASRGIEAKIKIAQLLVVEINCGKKFKKKTGMICDVK